MTERARDSDASPVLPMIVSAKTVVECVGRVAPKIL